VFVWLQFSYSLAMLMTFRNSWWKLNLPSTQLQPALKGPRSLMSALFPSIDVPACTSPRHLRVIEGKVTVRSTNKYWPNLNLRYFGFRVRIDWDRVSTSFATETIYYISRLGYILYQPSDQRFTLIGRTPPCAVSLIAEIQLPLDCRIVLVLTISIRQSD